MPKAYGPPESESKSLPPLPPPSLPPPTPPFCVPPILRAPLAPQTQAYHVLFCGEHHVWQQEDRTEAAYLADLKLLLHPHRSVLLATAPNPSWEPGGLRALTEGLSRAFRHVHVYQVHYPVWPSGHAAIVFASDTVDPLKDPIDWGANALPRDQALYYTPDLHWAAFMLPSAVARNVSATASWRAVEANIRRG